MSVEEATTKVHDRSLRITRRVTFVISTVRRRSKDREDRYFVRVLMKFSGKTFLLNEQESNRFAELIDVFPTNQKALRRFVRRLLTIRGVRLGVTGSGVRFDNFQDRDIVARCVDCPDVETNTSEQTLSRPQIKRVCVDNLAHTVRGVLPSHVGRACFSHVISTRLRPLSTPERRGDRQARIMSLRRLIDTAQLDQAHFGSGQEEIIGELDEVVSTETREVFLDDKDQATITNKYDDINNDTETSEDEPKRIKPVETDKKNDSEVDIDEHSESGEQD